MSDAVDLEVTNPCATTAFKRLVRLDGVNVTAVDFLATMVVVTVALCRRRLLCPHCDHSTRWRYDTRPVVVGQAR